MEIQTVMAKTPVKLPTGARQENGPLVDLVKAPKERETQNQVTKQIES